MVRAACALRIEKVSAASKIVEFRFDRYMIRTVELETVERLAQDRVVVVYLLPGAKLCSPSPWSWSPPCELKQVYDLSTYFR